MGKMIINGKECEFSNERNVLEVIRKNGSMCQHFAIDLI